ncbi:MAG: tetratricopeptide repeat protein [Steroidobacteraceae bacterium]
MSPQLLRVLKHPGVWVTTLLLMVVAAAFAVFWFRAPFFAQRTPVAPPPPLKLATFVGSQRCAECHQAEHAAWQQSHHAKAMQHATPSTVAGDFSGVTYTQDGITSTFLQRGNEFIVRTDGPDGQLADFEVKYTFGIEPMQQYLVELPGGRLQALALSWDTRPRESGGQRWFRQYPNERIDHRDELHWTKRSQNWNFMCADCHSTDVRKGYDAAADTFDTRFAEVSVGCEACHGPASTHLEWARGPRASTPDQSSKGFTVLFDERRGVGWPIDAASGNARRSRLRETAKELNACAPCHSRRSQFAEGWRPGDALMQHFLPVTLRESLYHADGQQQGEVFIWGSFVQSRMHQAGVTCSDCHDPHSQKLRHEGNAICAQCHAPARYERIEHHRHEAGSAAAQCVACHMPATTYMVIDPRRDHGFKIPRPDLTLSTGAPNACGSCHTDQSTQWALDALQQWHGPARRANAHYGDFLHAGRTARAGAARGLQGLAGDLSQPAIVRATALELLQRYPSEPAQALLQRGLVDADALLRHVAVSGYESLPPAERIAALAPRLRDATRAVRMEAARLLLPVATQLDVGAKTAFTAAISEYEATLRTDLSQPEARFNLGNLLWQRGDGAAAEGQFRAALQQDPRFAPARVNLAELLRSQGRETEAEASLREGLEVDPESPILRESLALSLVRQGKKPEAFRQFERAARGSVATARQIYLYALALDDANRRPEALRVLAEGTKRYADRDLLLTLALWQSEGGNAAAAREALAAWQRINPDDPALPRSLASE